MMHPKIESVRAELYSDKDYPNAPNYRLVISKSLWELIKKGKDSSELKHELTKSYEFLQSYDNSSGHFYSKGLIELFLITNDHGKGALYIDRSDYGCFPLVLYPDRDETKGNRIGGFRASLSDVVEKFDDIIKFANTATDWKDLKINLETNVFESKEHRRNKP